MDLFNQAENKEKMRRAMVEHQIRSRGIVDEAVLLAMNTIPREIFVPDRYRDDAYNDSPLPIGSGQTISQPYMVALMTACLDLTHQSKILEIGTGSGYQMAVLLQITPTVYSIERIPSLAESASATLRQIGFGQPLIKIGDGSYGWPEEAPFDGIVVTSAAPSIPEILKSQLADGGRLVIPVGTMHSQMLYKIVRSGSEFSCKEITPCVFVPLIGRHAWND